MGGAAVLARLAPHFEHVYAGDAHEDLVLMWQAAQAGWVPPEFVPRALYDELRNAEPSALRGFVGYGSSFSGKWFGGYCDRPVDRHKGKNYIMPSFAGTASRAIVRDVAHFRHAVLKAQSYGLWSPGSGTLVYCDPPYANTLGYGAVEGFDHRSFWSTMGEWSRQGATVIVSESSAPEGWTALASRERKAMLKAVVGTEQDFRQESLFILDSHLGVVQQ